MSKYRPLYSNLWNDPDFENFTVEQKLIFIFLITNSAVEKSGIYKITIKQISFYTDIQKEVINEFINKLINLGKIKYDFENGIIFIKNVFKFQKGMIRNKKIMFICLIKNYQMVKTEFWQDFFSLYGNDEVINEFINDNINKEIKDLIINKKSNEVKKTKAPTIANEECKSELDNNKNISIEKNELDIFCQQITNDFKDILENQLKRKITTTGWQKDIKLIITKDLQPRGEYRAKQDLIACIQAVADNYQKDYFPIIQSAKSLREKFVKIESYVKRNNSPQKLTKDQQQDLINKQLEEMYANNQNF